MAEVKRFHWVHWRRLSQAFFLLAFLALAWGILAIAIRTLLVLSPLDVTNPILIVYIIFLVCLAAVAGTLGFLGGKLTFPYE